MCVADGLSWHLAKHAGGWGGGPGQRDGGSCAAPLVRPRFCQPQAPAPLHAPSRRACDEPTASASLPPTPTLFHAVPRCAVPAEHAVGDEPAGPRGGHPLPRPLHPRPAGKEGSARWAPKSAGPSSRPIPLSLRLLMAAAAAAAAATAAAAAVVCSPMPRCGLLLLLLLLLLLWASPCAVPQPATARPPPPPPRRRNCPRPRPAASPSLKACCGCCSPERWGDGGDMPGVAQLSRGAGQAGAAWFTPPLPSSHCLGRVSQLAQCATPRLLRVPTQRQAGHGGDAWCTPPLPHSIAFPRSRALRPPLCCRCPPRIRQSR